ncbi:MAG: LytR C-terminal domain-containing protein [Hamadaea sp.]|uniref:LytR C-terminal domain-containing protein n=1 Tax=Hamadaea sp. TaxID=2024425 RepID=UPI00183C0F93|nr:LytR C-terminal domain-containing protein [Hamadaea sp.]NUR72501.1 LytR C-terminal domain-containing protein [Hamadaea sp.]NUT19681.1 LytR C-terminal domain-containing protein [Hamadaea sp.]
MSFARIRALALVAVLVLAAGVLTVMALVKGSGSSATPDACPSGYTVVDMKLPDDPRTIHINVYNATDKAGLATSVKLDFEYRRFKVEKTGNNPLGKPVSGVAILRYGPKRVGAAYVLDAYFLNNAVHEYDKNRTDETVDVILGPGFKQLATQTEVNQAFTALAGAGGPQLPKNSCAAKEDN